MNSETTAEATGAAETPAEPEAQLEGYPAGPACPRCGSEAVALVELVHGADFRADAYGELPEQGATIAECGVCQSFVVVEHGPEPEPETEAVEV